MIACALTYLLWALPGAAKNLPPSQSSNACSAGAHSEKPVESVPIQVGGVDDGAGFAVSIAELKQRTPRKAKRAFRKGLNALRHSRTVEGERFLKEALTIDPHYFQAAAGLAALYFDLKRYPAARLYAELAHTIDPEYVPPLCHPWKLLGPSMFSKASRPERSPNSGWPNVPRHFNGLPTTTWELPSCSWAGARKDLRIW